MSNFAAFGPIINWCAASRPIPDIQLASGICWIYPTRRKPVYLSRKITANEKTALFDLHINFHQIFNIWQKVRFKTQLIQFWNDVVMIPIIHLRLLLSWGSYRIRFHFIQPFIHTTKECKIQSPANRNSALHLWTSVFSMRKPHTEIQSQKLICLIFIKSRITRSIRLQSPV